MASSLESLHQIKLKALQTQSCLEGDDGQWIEKIKEILQGSGGSFLPRE